MADTRYFLDNKKSDILKLNIYDNTYMDKELDMIFRKIEMTNDKKKSKDEIEYHKSNVGINKSKLEYDRRTIASENFTLRQTYLAENKEFNDDMKNKKKISRVDIIDSLNKLDFKFGDILEDDRFKREWTDSSNLEDEQDYKNSVISEDASDNNAEIEKKHGLNGFDLSKFNRENYFPIFKNKYEIKTENSHSFLEKLKKTRDFGGSMINPPRTEIYLVDKSSLRGKFMISQPLFNEINPYFDFGDEILSIFRSERLVSNLNYEFFGGYTIRTLFKKQGVLDDLEFCLQISGYIEEKEKLFSKQDNTDQEIDQALVDYLGLFYADSSKREAKVEDKKSEPTLKLGGASKVRYYERPEKHQMKRNFQVQVDIDTKHERTLTLNDFENKMKNLVNTKKKFYLNKTSMSKTDYDLYTGEIEDTLDIILNLKPELLKSGIYQTFNQKIKLLLKNVKKFKGVYLGKLYCPEIIVFILKEYLQLEHGLKLKEKEEKKVLKVNQNGVEKKVKYYENSIRNLEQTLVHMKRRKIDQKASRILKKNKKFLNNERSRKNLRSRQTSKGSFQDIFKEFKFQNSGKSSVKYDSEQNYSISIKKEEKVEKTDQNLIIPIQIQSKNRERAREINEDLLKRASMFLNKEEGEN